MLNATQACGSLGVATTEESAWGVVIVCVFAVFLYAELGFTMWSLWTAADARIQKKA